MTYWPRDWECRRIAGKGGICEFYDRRGVNNQCGHPSRSCVYSSEEELYQINSVGSLENLAESIPLSGKN